MPEISEMFRKMALFGIGTIALSQEKIEEFAEEMVTKGELNREEGKKFVLEFLSEKKRQCKDIEEKINERVKDTVKDSGVAMQKDVDELSGRMMRIEKAFDRLRQI